MSLMKNMTIENIVKACDGTFVGDEKFLSMTITGVEKVNRQKYNNKTEAEIICKYIEKSYKNNKAPSDKKGTSLDEKRIYRRLKEYLQRSEMSKLGLLIIFCIDTVYAKNKRKTVSRLLKNYGINDDTINKLKVFLTNDE